MQGVAIGPVHVVDQVFQPGFSQRCPARSVTVMACLRANRLSPGLRGLSERGLSAQGACFVSPRGCMLQGGQLQIRWLDSCCSFAAKPVRPAQRPQEHFARNEVPRSWSGRFGLAQRRAPRLVLRLALRSPYGRGHNLWWLSICQLLYCTQLPDSIEPDALSLGSRLQKKKKKKKCTHRIWHAVRVSI